MRIPLKWLLELCPCDYETNIIADLLTMSGTEVEDIEDLSVRFSGVVVGEIVEVFADDPLPGMFRCSVDYGEGRRAQVLSRAPNIEAGKLYPFAPIGATLFGGKKIDLIEFEGVLSEGMLCSGVEIGLGDPKDKLLEIASGTRVGADILELLRWDDVAFEMEVTPNRPDCYGVLGLARELSALSGIPLADEDHFPIQTGADVAGIIKIDIRDAIGCPRYTARIIENIKIGPSPMRIVGRLSACGIRSINCVVDATNYVMLMLSHPLHAFDLDKLGTDTIVIRNAIDGEKFVTLDGEERTMRSDYLMIATPERAIAIAGVMGGRDSEVDANTTRLLLESAYFDPRRIRRASRQLDLITDSSVRFERGVDPNGTVRAADECASLINFSARGEVRKGFLDAYPKRIEPVELPISNKKIFSVLGLEIPEKKYANYLTALGLEKSDSGWIVPTFRPDLNREIDLVEEIGRIHGYDKIEPNLRGAGPIPPKIPDLVKLGRKINALMPGLGFTEAQSDSLGRKRIYEAFCEELVELDNPISEDYRYMRPSIIPSLLSSAIYNLNRNANTIRLYEYDKAYRLDGGESKEEYRLGAIMAGRNDNSGWYSSDESVDIFDFKGSITALFDALGVVCNFDPVDSRFYAIGKAFNIIDSTGVVLGSAGLITDEIASLFKLEIPVFSFELSAERLASHVSGIKKYRGLPKYPSTRRDVALIVDRKIPAGELLNEARKHSSDALENVFIFDLYEGKPIPEGKKSVGIAATFRSPKATITDEEANNLHEKMITGLLGKYAATIRE